MRNFLKQTFASTLGSLLGLLIFLGSGIGLLLMVIAITKQADPEVKDKSVLVFDLSLNITDEQSSRSGIVQQALSGKDNSTVSLRTVLDTLEKARRDPRIVGIYLHSSKNLADINAGFATLQEVRQGLQKFRDAGKTITAYDVNWGKRAYFVSSVANSIVLNPMGGMEIKGLASVPMFYAGALQKYGVGVQVVRVGKFKGAVEPFLLTKLSPENREQTQQLLDDVWSQWRTSVGKSRNVSAEKLQTIADEQGLLEPSEAKTQGLVDRVAYLDEVVTDLKKLTNSDREEKTFHQVSLTDYASVSGSSLGMERHSGNKIAVVYAQGEIVDGQGTEGEVGGDRFARIFRRIRQDKSIKAVVLRVNSPGGSVTGADVFQREIDLTSKVKPVVVSMGDLAASGGYWISANAKRIFAEPNTITGSIGVFGRYVNVQKIANDNGITWDAVKTAKYADSEGISRPKSEQELALAQRSVDRIYNVFLNKVSQGRKLSEQKVAEIAQGRVWSGTAAKEIGLVDEIGGLDTTIGYTAKLAGLGNDWELQEYPERSNFEFSLPSVLTSQMRAALGLDAQTPADPMTAEFQKISQELRSVQKMNDPLGIYARLPFNLNIK
ncbi:MAG: signal peptide peptidase SppA [Nostocaceae cyanobacterium]|nr:signal peptide peptidase SppA [Nostocaceae cyanobacterium]